MKWRFVNRPASPTHEAALHMRRLYPNLLLERFAAVLDFSHVPLQQRDGVIAAL